MAGGHVMAGQMAGQPKFGDCLPIRPNPSFRGPQALIYKRGLTVLREDEVQKRRKSTMGNKIVTVYNFFETISDGSQLQ